MTAVRIPPVLRAQAGNNKKVEVTGATVGEALESLLGEFPGLREQIFTDDGSLNRFVNVYVNGRDVRYEQELEKLQIELVKLQRAVQLDGRVDAPAALVEWARMVGGGSGV